MSNGPGRLAPSLLLAFLVMLPPGAEAGPNALLQAGPIVACAARPQHVDRLAPEPDAAPSARADARRRPGMLVPLYVSFGVLQGARRPFHVDGHAPRLSRGCRPARSAAG